MSKSDIQPLGAATRNLIGAEAVADHDRAVLASRLECKMDQVRRFLIWMDGQGIPRRQFSTEWFDAIAPTLPECRAIPKRQSKRERNWTWLLADALYLERNGIRGPERFNHLRSIPPFSGRWKSQDAKTLEIRLSEARNKSAIGHALKAVEDLSGSAARQHFETALIEAVSARHLQSVVTDF